MTYLISDIHGESDRFFRLLKEIQFSDEDILYILGDVVDRGPDGIMLLQYIMQHRNMYMLLGNHEYMFFDAITNIDDPYKQYLWESNGGYATYEKFCVLQEDEKKKVLNYIQGLPDQFIIQAHGERVLLVHGSPGYDTYEKIWNRPSIDQLPLMGDTVVIVGHTPTAFFRGGKIDKPLSIYYDNKFIGLDCGCGHSTSMRRLACLRVDDMREFYV